jgi:hypothetical protein
VTQEPGSTAQIDDLPQPGVSADKILAVKSVNHTAGKGNASRELSIGICVVRSVESLVDSDGIFCIINEVALTIEAGLVIHGRG